MELHWKGHVWVLVQCHRHLLTVPPGGWGRGGGSRVAGTGRGGGGHQLLWDKYFNGLLNGVFFVVSWASVFLGQGRYFTGPRHLPRAPPPRPPTPPPHLLLPPRMQQEHT